MVVVREDYASDYAEYKHIVIPDRDAKQAARDRKSHVGTVLAMGAPAQTSQGVDVPHGFDVGDRVCFHWVNYEAGFTRPWTDGEMACWIPQAAVDGVVAT
jgi:co-chaperonin GroES (HSP10)